jgi:hypothetical protein
MSDNPDFGGHTPLTQRPYGHNARVRGRTSPVIPVVRRPDRAASRRAGPARIRGVLELGSVSISTLTVAVELTTSTSEVVVGTEQRVRDESTAVQKTCPRNTPSGGLEAC